jgi:hypothetical protein
LRFRHPALTRETRKRSAPQVPGVTVLGGEALV